MQLTFLYHPADDLQASVAFHRDQLGLEEAWRDGDDIVAFWLPGQSAQIMVSTTAQPAGAMYLVDSVEEWLRAHGDVPVTIEKYSIPGGSVVGLQAPGGHAFYVFDQPDA